MVAVDFTPRLEEIKELIAKGASLNVMTRRMGLRHDQALRGFLRRNYPELYAAALENGKKNSSAPLKRKLV